MSVAYHILLVQKKGSQRMGRPVVHFEIGCRDRGKTLVGPIDIPDGSFAWFADPDGNTIGLWKPKA